MRKSKRNSRKKRRGGMKNVLWPKFEKAVRRVLRMRPVFQKGVVPGASNEFNRDLSNFFKDKKTASFTSKAFP